MCMCVCICVYVYIYIIYLLRFTLFQVTGERLWRVIFAICKYVYK